MISYFRVTSFRGANKRPSGGDVAFEDKPGKLYNWSYEMERSETGAWIEGEKITLMGSKKLSLGHTRVLFYSAKREQQIRDFLENKY